jgi:heme/copper-type cytochrome/quinol oxidase subunit 1
MSKQKRIKIKECSKKDAWDKWNIILTIALTVIIASANVILAVVALRIPHIIEDSALNDWNEVYYEEALKWKGSSIDSQDPIIEECSSLEINNHKILSEPMVTCPEGKNLFAEIKKDQHARCYYRLIGNC